MGWPDNSEVVKYPEPSAAQLIDSPLGKAVAFKGAADSVLIPRSAAMNVGDGDYTVSHAAFAQMEPLPRRVFMAP